MLFYFKQIGYNLNHNPFGVFYLLMHSFFPIYTYITRVNGNSKGKVFFFYLMSVLEIPFIGLREFPQIFILY